MNFRKHFKYKQPLVLGLAKSGTAAASVLLDYGLDVRINDMNATNTDENVQDLKRRGAHVVIGEHPLSVLDKRDVVIKNPGIRYDHPIVAEAMKREIPVITEVELASLLANDHDVIGVTGSNGKTTTTMLIYEMLKKSNEQVKLAGNIGIVATDVARTLEPHDKLLVELSSFQLQGVETFRPHIAVLLNLFDAHLDYHGTKEAYVRAKANLFRKQRESDYLIYNEDDEQVAQVINQARAKTIPFTKEKRAIEGAWADDSYLYFYDEKIIARKEIVLVGDHNLENILAAVAAAKIAGATNEGIIKVLTTFSGVKHRLQYVTELNGRLFYNDSKATNMLATEKALRSFSKPTILLAGGLDRGDDFSPLIPYLNNVKACVLFGETKEKIASVAKQAGVGHVYLVEDVRKATEKAYEISEREDIILLSPACASWDQYKTFEERGDMFIQTVHNLK